MLTNIASTYNWGMLKNVFAWDAIHATIKTEMDFQKTHQPAHLQVNVFFN